MTRQALFINGEQHSSYKQRDEATETHRELLDSGEITLDDSFSIMNEWYVSEHYDDEHIYWGNDEYEVDLYIEPPSDRHPQYHVGLFDRTMSSVVIPEANKRCRSFRKALCHAFSLVQHLDEYVSDFREREDYQRAMMVEKHAPPFVDGNLPGFIPGYKVSKAKRKVYSDDMTVGQAVNRLYNTEGALL